MIFFFVFLFLFFLELSFLVFGNIQKSGGVRVGVGVWKGVA